MTKAETILKAREAAKLLGFLGGSSTSPAKQAASRINGKLGGRPKAGKKAKK